MKRYILLVVSAVAAWIVCLSVPVFAKPEEVVRVSIPAPDVRAGERVVGFSFKTVGGSIRAFRKVPAG